MPFRLKRGEDGSVHADFTYPAQPGPFKLVLTMQRADVARVIMGIREFIKQEDRKRKRRGGRPRRGHSAAEYAAYLADLEEVKDGLEKAFMMSRTGEPPDQGDEVDEDAR